MNKSKNMSGSTIKNSYSAAELAGLPGMPSTNRRVKARADREMWPSIKRTGRGGGREYPLACLPAETRDAIAAQLVSAQHPGERRCSVGQLYQSGL
jgi:putative transposase